MYSIGNYLHRGGIFLNNRLFPSHKKLSRLMVYATDLCDSACKHCLIWAKRPVQHLPKESILALMESKCITRQTNIGLEGGEFMLHPEAMPLLAWFKKHHPNFDLLSNCLKPEPLIEAVLKFPPSRLYVSLDGTAETYTQMRGKPGYGSVLQVIERLHKQVPISVMFTLSPYNDFDDLAHVADVCTKYGIDLRVGVYNNVPLFDTWEKAHETEIGQSKQMEALRFRDVTNLKPGIDETRIRKQEELQLKDGFPVHNEEQIQRSFVEKIPAQLKSFQENYDYLVLYDAWRKKQVRMRCFSILDSLVVLPNGDVPICQNLDLVLGNIHKQSLDDIFNNENTRSTQKHYSENCNQCWLAFHRKYDVALYRTLEKNFGKRATAKLLGYYHWSDNHDQTLEALEVNPKSSGQ